MCNYILTIVLSYAFVTAFSRRGLLLMSVDSLTSNNFFSNPQVKSELERFEKLSRFNQFIFFRSREIP